MKEEMCPFEIKKRMETRTCDCVFECVCISVCECIFLSLCVFVRVGGCVCVCLCVRLLCVNPLTHTRATFGQPGTC